MKVHERNDEHAVLFVCHEILRLRLTLLTVLHRLVIHIHFIKEPRYGQQITHQINLQFYRYVFFKT